MDAVAVYGAIAGTAASAWQVYSWRRDRATRVEVAVWFGVIPGRDRLGADRDGH